MPIIRAPNGDLIRHVYSLPAKDLGKSLIRLT